MSSAPGQTRAAAAPVRLHWRLYRLYLLPTVLAVLIVGFSFGNQAPALRSTLVPEGFSGTRAFALLARMVALAPRREPGSAGDRRVLAFVEGQLRALGAAGSGGYSIGRLAQDATTSLGSRPLEVLIARRAGSSGQAPIVLAAHTDATARGRARAQLSGTAALLELASVFASSETKHPLELVFSEGGSAGGAGTAAYLSATPPRSIDAAIVLGDLAGTTLTDRFVAPASNALGAAPEELERTVEAALGSTLGRSASAPGSLGQLVHLAFPLAVGEQGLFNAAGEPAVGVSFAGEGGPAVGEAVSAARLEAAGRGLLNAFYALDAAPEASRSASVGLRIGERTLSAWALRLLIGTLLLAPLALSLDALVRVSRRGRGGGRWISLALSCGLPIFAAAVLVKLLAAAGLLAAPPAPVPAEGLVFSAGAALTLAFAAVALGIGMRVWWRRLASPLLRRAGGPAEGGVAALFVASALAIVVWIVNPYAALLLVGALHIWPLALCPENAPSSRAQRVALALLALAPIAVLLAYYAETLRLGAVGLLLSGLLLLGGGQIGWAGALLWSVALGLLATIVLAALAGPEHAAFAFAGRARSRSRSARLQRRREPSPREPAGRVAGSADRM
ncbi:MAG: M28 family peptidase [Solirubrobacteraceae bacterium]